MSETPRPAVANVLLAAACTACQRCAAAAAPRQAAGAVTAKAGGRSGDCMTVDRFLGFSTTCQACAGRAVASNSAPRHWRTGR